MTMADGSPIPARPLVRLKGIRKVFSNGTEAIRGLDLDIHPGEFISLLGPSGCGKSTALRMIAGLGEASEGEIEWPTAMYDSSGKPEREIGFVFQEPTLMPWATVFDNVALPFTLKDRPKGEVPDRVAEALKMVGLERFAKSYPRELSGGMKMRVSIARALVMRPKVLLMDEPFAALDEITRFKLNNDLLELWNKQRWTVVFVTHSVYESVYLSTRIVVMAARPGRIVGELGVDAGYPRGTAFRTSQPYNDACRRVSELLDDAMAANPAGVEEH
ncbi:ABC transporter ATP-binding protein [Halotia wernerae UHCC 0503]|jgi:NitT/TauT family transport system ATP-binding protein|nr:ABC transporter ATP-binding protein [Halotia wernerae UHCC 0503]